MFALEVPLKGEISEHVIANLVRCRNEAKDYAQAFSDAEKRVAEKHQVKQGALRRYVAAVADDNVRELDQETDDLAQLIDHGA